METISYTQVQALLKQVPQAKLQTAYRLLADLITGDTETLSFQEEYMSFSLNERCRIMAQQAEQMVAHYQKRTGE